MKFIIHHEPSDDSIILEGDTIEDIRNQVEKENTKRGWNDADCWSESCE